MICREQCQKSFKMSLKGLDAKMFESRMAGVSIWIEICSLNFKSSTWRELARVVCPASAQHPQASVRAAAIPLSAVRRPGTDPPPTTESYLLTCAEPVAAALL